MRSSAAAVTVVTAGHLSTCPRMLKAADALAEAGYRVRVVSARFLDWAAETDEEAGQSRSWPWTAVDYSQAAGRGLRWRSGLRAALARRVGGIVGAGRLPLGLAARAYGRIHPELVRAVLAGPGDLIYGGTSGALAAVAEAGRRAGVPWALDLEDYHGSEGAGGGEARLEQALAERVLAAILPGAVFRTAGSEAIAGACRERYGVEVIPIHNAFPLPAVPPDLAPSPQQQPLSLYWFSQSVGRGRGLGEVVRGVGRAGIRARLHLRGRPLPGVLEGLRELAREVAPELEIRLHPPAAPDRMVELCRGHDVGLAPEPGFSLNNRLALSNKALTYILAGLPVALSATPGQEPLGRDLGEGALLYPPGDVGALAAGLARWDRDREALGRARRAAWEAARRRWHWEHREEKGALLAAVEQALAERRPQP